MEGDFSLREIFDFGRGIFKDVLDNDRFELELQLAKEAKAAEEATLQRFAPITTSGGLSDVLGGNTGNLLLLAGGAVALVWAFRKFAK